MSTKRFTTEAQILAAIDKCKADAQAKLAEAERLEADAKTLSKKLYDAGAVWSPDAGDAFVELEHKLEEVDRLKKAATRLLESKAKKLGEKLSEFRTGALVPLTGQKGIGDMSVKA